MYPIMTMKTTDRGFTLIETLVYLALFTLMIGGLVISAYALFESNDRNQTKAMLQEEANFVMAKIVRTLDNAASASVSGGSMLTVTKYDLTTVVVSTTSSNVFIGGSRLNNENVTIDDLLFVRSGGGSAPESVEISITASARTPKGMIVTQSASTTRYIRK